MYIWSPGLSLLLLPAALPVWLKPQLCAGIFFAERQWNMWIPGFGSEEIRPYKKACTTEAHKQVRGLGQPGLVPRAAPQREYKQLPPGVSVPCAASFTAPEVRGQRKLCQSFLGAVLLQVHFQFSFRALDSRSPVGMLTCSQ